MRRVPFLPHHKDQRGIALMEALIAILIFSFGILGLVALQANMIQAGSEAKYRAEATYIAQQRIGLIWVNQPTADKYTEDDNADHGTDISEEAPGLPQARRITVRDNVNPNHVVVTVSWQHPGSTKRHSVSMEAYITGGNPTASGGGS